MRFRLLIPIGTILLLNSAAGAQTIPFPVSGIGKVSIFGPTFAGACSVSGTAISANTNIATVSPSTFQKTGTNPNVNFSITGTGIGSVQVTISYTEVNGTGCTGQTTGSFVLSVTVSGTPLVYTSGNFVNAGEGGEPVSTATGELFGHDETADLSLGGPLGLQFRRYYASYLTAAKVVSAMGTNWMHNFDVSLAVSGKSATVTLFRGKTVTFGQSGSAWNLSSTEQRPYQLAAVTGGGYQFLDPTSNLIYTFSSSGALGSISDRNGNTLTITQGSNGPALVSDGLGRTLTFTYTAAILTKVQDQSGRSVSFQYSNGALSAWTNANGNQATFTYTAGGGLIGLMTAETRPAGNKPFTQTFDTTGRVSTQSDSFSNAMTFAYSVAGATLTETAGLNVTQASDANNNLTSMSDPGGGVSKYGYDSNNRPISVTDRLGNQTTATWDAASGLPATYTDEFGNTTKFAYAASTIGPFTFYDRSGETLADGTTITLKRDAKGNITSLTDQAGNSRQATYNANGWLTTLTNPAGGVYTFSYNNDGTLASLQTPSSDTTKYAYDSVGRLNLVTNPDGSTKSLQYDGLDNVMKAVDERSGASSASFDANNNGKTTTDALAATTASTFDTDDRLTSVTDPLGNAVTAAWDAQSRLKSLTNAMGNSIVYTYDSLNRVTAIADASGNGLTFGLDAENRPTSVIDGLSRTVSYTRDAHGNVTGIATPKKEIYSFTFDSLNRLVASTDPLGRATQYTLDPRGIVSTAVLPAGVGAAYGLNQMGRVTSVTDPVGNVWNRTFDSMGRLTSKTDPLTRATSFAYDSRQRMDSATLPGGTAQLSYDAANNLTAVKYSDGTSLTYIWDADNRLTAASGASFSYDSAGRVRNSNGLKIERDTAGRIASVTYAPNKTVTYNYNNRGFLSQVNDWVGSSTTFTYDAAGQLTAMTFANGVTQTYTWDADGLLLTLIAGKGGATLSSIALARDALGRVTSAARSSANIPSEAKGTLPLAYDAASQVLGETFDGMGRVTKDALRTYSWDLASHLTSYSGSDGAASFTYDAAGQRLSRTSAGATQNYVWNYAFPLPVLSTVQSGGSDQTYYVWLPDGTLLNSISAADNTRRFYHFDESGSAVLLTDSTGAVTDTYAASIYGDTETQTGTTANPFTWQGKFGVMREAATSLYYMRARFYDSGPARFLSRDPLPSADPRAINPYQFARANPIEHADPSGRASDAGTSVAAHDALYAEYHDINKPGNRVICSAIGALFVKVFFPGELPVLEAEADSEYRQLLAESDQRAACDQGQAPIPSRSQWITDYENTVTETLVYEPGATPQVESVIGDIGIDRLDMGSFLKGQTLPGSVPKVTSSDTTSAVKTAPLIKAAIQQAEEPDPQIIIRSAGRGAVIQRAPPQPGPYGELNLAISLLDPDVELKTFIRKR